jgi:uncharacterized 2Fe-2S/4Fe-4S cluster protein (DUF4445 family)
MGKGVHPKVTEEGLVLGKDPDVIFRPEDVAAVQEAKAAIAATFRILLDRMGMRAADLRQVYLSGAFGSRLNTQSAVKIGLLPPLGADRYVPSGNTALLGASYALLSKGALRYAGELVGKIRHASVAEDGRFEGLFLDNLYFPGA